MLLRPDVLVLGGGGILGEAWMMGVLAGIEDAAGLDLRECEAFVGTSAGSIVAAHLAAGRSPRRPSTLSSDIELASDHPANALVLGALTGARRASELALEAWSPLAPLALAAAAPAGALVRAAALAATPRPTARLSDLRRRVADYGARFDGRLRVACVDRKRGRRTVFGSPGAPPAGVAEAVEASCSVPWLFAPVAIAGREYVDGGVWSATNLDVAPATRDTYVLCLNPTAGVRGAHALLAVARNLARSAVSIEALALRRRGAVVRTVHPNLECAAAMGGDFMDPEPRRLVLGAGYRQGLTVAGAG
ncbi:MAG TPA: patatin-like phospholipase family protein [Solirubrobacteraceae bacterium]|jgi:NTE family protein|nr:patatin-like phospholipase family protein [Solirubrobacteraceae bacterium]